MIPEELFGKIIKYHLLDQEQEADDIRKGKLRLDGEVAVNLIVVKKGERFDEAGKIRI